MGKCNLIAPVANTTGNFILFSQYAEDLTKSSRSEDFYRVTPSKYVLLNLGVTGMDPVELAEFFQNYYENACAVMRSSEGVNWTPDCATAMLWKTLFKSGLVMLPSYDSSTSAYTSPSVVRIGDINITSTRQFDGINFSEIYVNVPQGSKRQKCTFTKYSADQTRIVQYPFDYIAGYPDSEYPQPTGVSWPSNRVSAQYSDGTVLVGSDTEFIYELKTANDFFLDMESVSEMEDASYVFNAAIVLYDIVKKNLDDPGETTVYSGIPMGLYLTGAPDSNGEIQNPVTLWVSNQDIYEQGTSYGIRICTRYLSTQNALFIVDSTIEDTEDMYDQYAAVMGKIGDSQVKMDEMMNRMQSYQNNITSHLANIANYRVNVPYIRNVGGTNYWFVNGKNLGVATTSSSIVWENY